MFTVPDTLARPKQTLHWCVLCDCCLNWVQEMVPDGTYEAALPFKGDGLFTANLRVAEGVVAAFTLSIFAAGVLVHQHSSDPQVETHADFLNQSSVFYLEALVVFMRWCVAQNPRYQEAR